MAFRGVNAQRSRAKSLPKESAASPKKVLRLAVVEFIRARLHEKSASKELQHAVDVQVLELCMSSCLEKKRIHLQK